MGDKCLAPGDVEYKELAPVVFKKELAPHTMGMRGQAYAVDEKEPVPFVEEDDPVNDDMYMRMYLVIKYIIIMHMLMNMIIIYTSMNVMIMYTIIMHMITYMIIMYMSMYMMIMSNIMMHTLTLMCMAIMNMIILFMFANMYLMCKGMDDTA